jgi:hypothetical protein
MVPIILESQSRRQTRYTREASAPVAFEGVFLLLGLGAGVQILDCNPALD